MTVSWRTADLSSLSGIFAPKTALTNAQRGEAPNERQQGQFAVRALEPAAHRCSWTFDTFPLRDLRRPSRFDTPSAIRARTLRRFDLRSQFHRPASAARVAPPYRTSGLLLSIIPLKRRARRTGPRRSLIGYASLRASDTHSRFECPRCSQRASAANTSQ